MTVIKLADLTPALSPDTVLTEAMGVYGEVVVVGYDKDGNLDARASLNLNSAQILWLLEAFKMQLLQGQYADN